MNDETRPQAPHEIPAKESTDRVTLGIRAKGPHFAQRLQWRRKISRALDLLLDDSHRPDPDALYAVLASREPEDVASR